LAEILTPDLCVIGAGIGGLTAVAEARALGASVVLIERHKLGGNSLHTATVPSRAMAAAAAHAQAVRTGGPFGIAADEPRINTRRVRDHVDQVIASLASRDAQTRLEALGAQVVMGEARFTDPRTVAVGAEYEVKAKRFILATGARSVVPPIPGLDAVPYFTLETIFDNTRKLTHLVIIGAGPVGLELAQSYRRLGTQVTVVEAGGALAGSDPELSAIALQRLREEGAEIREGTTVTAILGRSQGIGVAIHSTEGDATLDVSHILLAEARVPDIDALDLDRGSIQRQKADTRRPQDSAGLKTSNRRVYAIGDAAGGGQSAALAVWQAEQAVRGAVLGVPVRLDPALVPTITYTDPEIAQVGLTEEEARKKLGDKFTVVRAAYGDNDRAKAGREGFGVAKLLVGSDGRIVGAGVAGERAGELIAILSFAMANRLGAASLSKFVAGHPTFAEIIRALGVEYSRGRGVTPLMQRLAAVVRLGR
jgi:pyruvate/2-oxoglutarate dehydrogenase complex dihydrolipoamide dehydrogenase (E3) component